MSEKAESTSTSASKSPFRAFYNAIVDIFDFIELVTLIYAVFSILFRFKARLQFPSITIEAPVVIGLTLEAFIGLKFTPPPPPDVTDVNDPRVPKMFFTFPTLSKYAVTGEGMKYDLTVVFIRGNTVVEVAHLAKDTVYTPRESYTSFLEVHSDFLPESTIRVGDTVNITYYYSF